MGPDGIAPVLVVFVIFGMPIAYAIINRVLAHQERLEMLRRGITPPPDPRLLRRMAKYGAPPYGVPPPQPGFDPYNNPRRANGQLRGGIVVTLVGFAITVGLSLIRPGHPGPELLGGLIPLFIGIAQIIIAMMAGAQFGSFTLTAPVPPQAQQQASPPPPGQQPNRPQDTGSPYGWRPGPITELERPVNPPDVRH